MFAAARLTQRIVNSRARLIDVTQICQIQCKVGKAHGVWVLNRKRCINGAVRRIAHVMALLEKGAGHNNLPEIQAADPAQEVTIQQGGFIVLCLAELLHLLGQQQRLPVLGSVGVEHPLEIEEGREVIGSIRLLGERPHSGVRGGLVARDEEEANLLGVRGILVRGRRPRIGDAAAVCRLRQEERAGRADTPREGEPAPDVALPAANAGKAVPGKKDGDTLNLSDLKGKKNVVLFFFPKAMTRG